MEQEFQKGKIVIYTTDDGSISLDAKLEDDTVWLSQKQMAELFGVKTPAISKHLKNIFKEGALTPIPHPVIVKKYLGSNSWYETCCSILGLTKVDWNNNTLYKSSPITLQYSSLFAQVVRDVPEIMRQKYNYRFFM